MEIPTREEYESEISKFNSLIRKAQEDYNYQQGQNENNQRSTCPGFDAWCGKGLTCCAKWKSESQQAWNKNSIGLSKTIEQRKQDLWDYQKNVAKAEQEAQVKAVRQAIADQVRLEQERIQQSQQNQIIMQEAPPAEPEPMATMEPGNNLTQANILPNNFKLPFHENYLIPIIAIGGYLVLRH